MTGLMPSTAHSSIISCHSGYCFGFNYQFHIKRVPSGNLCWPTQSCIHTPESLTPTCFKYLTTSFTFFYPPTMPTTTPFWIHSGMGFMVPIVFEMILARSIGFGAEIKNPSRWVACQNIISVFSLKEAMPM